MTTDNKSSSLTNICERSFVMWRGEVNKDNIWDEELILSKEIFVHQSTDGFQIFELAYFNLHY